LYHKGRADTKDEAPGLATLIVLAAAPTGDAAAAGAAGDPDHYKPWGGAWNKHYKEEWMKRHAGQVEDVEKVKKSLNIAAGAAGAPAAGAADGVASVQTQKKRKPKFSPAKYEDASTSEEEKDDDMDNFVPPPPPAPLEGLRSPTEPFTLTELEDMHNKIVQKCAPLIDGFGALNIYEVSYFEQKLKEIKSAFKKDYDRNNQYVKFFKKVNKQVKTDVNDDVKGGSKGRKKK